MIYQTDFYRENEKISTEIANMLILVVVTGCHFLSPSTVTHTAFYGLLVYMLCALIKEYRDDEKAIKLLVLYSTLYFYTHSLILIGLFINSLVNDWWVSPLLLSILLFSFKLHREDYTVKKQIEHVRQERGE